MSKIILINPFNGFKLKKKNNYYIDKKNNKFIVRKNILRFTKNNYTKNFGYQWNKFINVQLTRSGEIEDWNFLRFFKQTQWKVNGLKNKKVLEVGSGAGRFTKVVLNFTKAILFSIDSSSAVDANYKNNYKTKFKKRFFLFQSSLYYLPFEDNYFDKIFCFGVLQHTPDYKKSLKILAKKLKKGGELIIDFYPKKGFYTLLHGKYFFRFFFKFLSEENLYKLIKFYIKPIYIIYKLLDVTGLHVFTRFLPICDIKNAVPKKLNKKKLYQWILLDTFDMFSPKYDNPISIKDACQILKKERCSIKFSGYVKFQNMNAAVIRATKN